MSYQQNLLRGRALAEGEEQREEASFFGDEEKQKKKTLRIVSQNCNGILKNRNYHILKTRE